MPDPNKGSGGILMVLLQDYQAHQIIDPSAILIRVVDHGTPNDDTITGDAGTTGKRFVDRDDYANRGGCAGKFVIRCGAVDLGAEGGV